MLTETTSFQFTFSNIENYFQKSIENGYKAISCQEYLNYKNLNYKHKIIVNRVDIDNSVQKAERLATIFNRLNITATFFVRLHAKEYNPFSFENYRILKMIRDSGHEIGYHSEIIDQSVIWNESAEECLVRDVDILNRMLNINIVGVASHGGSTGLNNLDFWKNKTPKEFNLLYEAYDRQPEFDLFHNSFFISDSNWTYWKCYKNGIFCEGDKRTLADHFNDKHNIIYSLIHPDTYYDKHFYE